MLFWNLSKHAENADNSALDVVYMSFSWRLNELWIRLWMRWGSSTLFLRSFMLLVKIKCICKGHNMFVLYIYFPYNLLIRTTAWLLDLGYLTWSMRHYMFTFARLGAFPNLDQRVWSYQHTPYNIIVLALSQCKKCWFWIIMQKLGLRSTKLLSLVAWIYPSVEWRHPVSRSCTLYTF